MLLIYSSSLYILTLIVTKVQSEVLVVDSTEKETLAELRSLPASFGRTLPEDGVHGRAVMSFPRDGCSTIKPPPLLKPTEERFYFTNASIGGLRFMPVVHSDPKNLAWIVLIARSHNCTFEDKVRNAQQSNYSAVIIYNVGSDKVIPMGGDDPSLIPSVFIGASDASLVAKLFTYNVNPQVRIILTDDEPFDINSYLLPFAVVVGICFLIMLGIVVFKCIQDHRRNRRHRLPKSALKKLPIHKFKNGDPYETCCICLDDFEEGDKLRVLPCDHGYHAKCIDPWLLKNKRICPQCRKKVFASNERGAGLLTGSGGSDSEEEHINERAPLLRQQASQRPMGAYGGTSASTSASVSTESPSTSVGDTSRPRLPFISRRRGRRTMPPFDNNDDVLTSDTSTSSSDDESNDTEHLIRQSPAHRHSDESLRRSRNISAEIHLAPAITEQVDDEAPPEVVVVVQSPRDASENQTSQISSVGQIREANTEEV